MDTLYNVKEAAEKLKISPLTLRGWIYEGKLIPVRLGRRVLITERELERFIEEGMRKGQKTNFSTQT
jgi:excisionase family DNA binding protein